MQAMRYHSALNFLNSALGRPMPAPASLAIFCKVVDNFGDIGICWRLARQLHQEHGLAVTLWVDDLPSFRRIWPPVDVDAPLQQLAGVTVRHWANNDGIFAPAEVADIVIEFFGCDIPPAYIEAMVGRVPRPLWFNLEGLSAEEWVEGCHTLPSSHPRLPLTKYFFFPGFTAKTGGLPHEAGLDAARDAFRASPAAMAGFLAQFGITEAEMASRKVSMFCYPHAPVAALFDAWRDGPDSVTCLVPEGVAADAVRAFIDGEGRVATRGALTVRVLPFVSQDDYDKLLWACDMNFVRGEDSFVRAQWAGRPFVWHIYPQDENLHHKKLRAFLDRYAGDLDALRAFSLHWNGASAGEPDWAALRDELPRIAVQAVRWIQQVSENGDLADNLLKFAATVRSSTPETKV